MKRFYLFTVLLCAFLGGATAQTKEFFKDKKHELRLSYGSVNQDSYYDRLYYGSGYGYGYYHGNYYFSFDSYFNPDASVYKGATKTTGVFNASYLYNMSGLGFSFGGTASYSGYNTDFYNRVTDRKVGSIKMHNIAITPMIRYSWISKEKFRLYSGIGWSFYWDIIHSELGIGDRFDGSKINETKFDTEFMVTPIGFSFGKEIFAFGEFNLGGRTGNFVGGVGYRF